MLKSRRPASIAPTKRTRPHARKLTPLSLVLEWQLADVERTVSLAPKWQLQCPQLAASGELGSIHEVTSPDDNLQAVFRYLVKA